MIAWRWKVDNLVARSDPRTKAGDDYPVRLQIAFQLDPSQLSLAERARVALAQVFYGVELPHSLLIYVWDRMLAPGTIVPNVHTDRARMIVVETGGERLGQWRAYERDVLADYRAAFGAAPPRVASIAIMTDTDDTGETVVAYYGDIVMKERSSAKP